MTQEKQSLSHSWPPKSSRYDAIVIGSGPNGLAAAVTLAQKKLSVLVVEANDTIGGGARTQELTIPGFKHDLCSAIHPMAIASPFYRSLPLQKFGLEWMHSPLPLAHPFLDGTAVAATRSIDELCASLGKDGKKYERLFRPLLKDLPALLDDALRPPLHIPKNPLLMARLGARAFRSIQSIAHGFETKEARALFAGLGAHSILPFSSVLSAAAAVMLGTVLHAEGWPFPRGGSQAITDAMAQYLESLGGEIIHGCRVHSLQQLPETKAVLFDTSPRALTRIAGDHLPTSYAEKLKKFQYGPSVFKVDFALSGPIPWKAESCHRAATVHVGGTYEDIADAESEVFQGTTPPKPFVIVAQPSLFDPTRAPPGKHTAWAYCHTPHRSNVDRTEVIEDQIERLAPGFRSTILAKSSLSPRDIELHNANNIGGDISGGTMSIRQFFARPVLNRDPYLVPTKNCGQKHLFLCSSSTPPGPGVHGMCGYNAAERALHHVFS